MRLGRRDIIGAIVALAIAGVCVRLGFWQLDRLGQRRARNAIVAARLALPPLRAERGSSPDSAHNRRVVAYGVDDFDHQLISTRDDLDGTPRVAFVDPLP